QAAMNVSAWFAGFNQASDYGMVWVYFFDTTTPDPGNPAANQIGSTVEIGGSGFTSAAWAQDSLANVAVPAGTRSLGVVVISHSDLATGDTDGYVDLIELTVTQVPEPSSLALSAFGCALLAARARRTMRRR